MITRGQVYEDKDRRPPYRRLLVLAVDKIRRPLPENMYPRLATDHSVPNARVRWYQEVRCAVIRVGPHDIPIEEARRTKIRSDRMEKNYRLISPPLSKEGKQ